MFFRILKKSLLKRKGKVTIAIIAVIMGVSIPAAMFAVSLDINEKINYEFRKFGANLLVVPKSEEISVGIGDVSLSSVMDQRFINETDINQIKTINWSKNILGYAPFLYQGVDVGNSGQEQRVVLVGTWFDKNTVLENGETFRTGVRSINGWWWGIEGNWIEDLNVYDNNETMCMVGRTVAEKMGLKLGDTITVAYKENAQDDKNLNNVSLKISGIITTGASEDNQIFVSLPVAQNLTLRTNKVHTIQVSALCTGCPIETIAEEIEAKITYTEAKSILQVTNAEMNVLNKIESMMTLVTIIALLATILGVSTTLTTAVLERRTEIGLMKSIGAENKKVASLFLSEAAIIGLIGGLIGYIIGIVVSQFIGLMIFNSFVSPQLIVLPVIVGLSLCVCLVASLVPVRRAMEIEPIVVLRGE
ncbi:MAG: ABC transporter permease [Candidatus Hodarchaeota archaeon]